MKRYIATVVFFPSAEVGVECLNVQGHGEGRPDLGLQTELLLQHLDFTDCAGHSSFTQVCLRWHSFSQGFSQSNCPF